jgi:hypothetical protein
MRAWSTSSTARLCSVPTTRPCAVQRPASAPAKRASWDGCELPTDTAAKLSGSRSGAAGAAAEGGCDASPMERTTRAEARPADATSGSERSDRGGCALTRCNVVYPSHCGALGDPRPLRGYRDPRRVQIQTAVPFGTVACTCVSSGLGWFHIGRMDTDRANRSVSRCLSVDHSGQFAQRSASSRRSW